MKPKIVIALNTAWNLYNFRAGLIQALVVNGYEVVAVAPHDQYAERLKEIGCRFVPLPMDNQGTHPGRDLILFCRFYYFLKRERPVLYIGYTVKPNIYGSLAAHLLGVPVINNISGLGAVFIKDSWLTSVVRGLYRVALSRSVKVFFQNDDDRQMFISGGLVAHTVADRLPGSGISLTKFVPVPLPSKVPIRFLLIARMLWDKGVGEFVEAARMLKRRGINADFCLLGFLDVQNPAAISRQQMNDWVAEKRLRKSTVLSFPLTEKAPQEPCSKPLPCHAQSSPQMLWAAVKWSMTLLMAICVSLRTLLIWLTRWSGSCPCRALSGRPWVSGDGKRWSVSLMNR
jgi:glycosyltransferase involved in cell wall biosynthesis